MTSLTMSISYNDSNLISAESSKLDFMVHHYNAKNQLVSSDYYWNKSIMSSDIKTIETTLSQSDMITSANSSKAGSIYMNITAAVNWRKQPLTGPSQLIPNIQFFL